MSGVGKLWSAASAGRGGRATRGGLILLEVVLSIALLVLGLSVLGAQMNRSRTSARADDDLTRLIMLAEAKVAELDTGLVDFDQDADDEVEGDFTLRFPDHGWRMRVGETATEGLRDMTLEILHAPRASLDEEFDFDGSEVVYTVHTLRAERALLDVDTDLNLDEETVQAMAETLPPECIDPPLYDPRCLQNIPIEDLLELLPSLVSLLGPNAEALLASVPPEVRALMDINDLSAGLGEPGADGGVDGSTELTDEDLELFNTNRQEFFGNSESGVSDGGAGSTGIRQPPRGAGNRQPPPRVGDRGRGRGDGSRRGGGRP